MADPAADPTEDITTRSGYVLTPGDQMEYDYVVKEQWGYTDDKVQAGDYAKITDGLDCQSTKITDTPWKLTDYCYWNNADTLKIQILIAVSSIFGLISFAVPWLYSLWR